jgi:hypothetical protein
MKKEKLLDRQLAAQRRVIEKLAKGPKMTLDFSPPERTALLELERDGLIEYNEGTWNIAQPVCECGHPAATVTGGGALCRACLDTKRSKT